MILREYKRITGLILALVMSLTFFSGISPALANEGQESLPEWHGRFYSSSAPGGENLVLEGFSSSIVGPVGVTFTGNGDVFEEVGTSDGTTLVLPFFAMPVGRYEVKISDNVIPAEESQVIGHYVAMTPFVAYNYLGDNELVPLGKPVDIVTTLAISGSGHSGNFPEHYQQGSEAKFILPTNVAAIDPVSGNEVFGEITVPYTFGGLEQGYGTQIQIKGLSGTSATVTVEVWKNGTRVGSSSIPNTEPMSIPIELSFTDGPVVPENSTMQVVDGENGRYADGIDSHTVQIETKNAYGITIPGSDEELASFVTSAAPATGVEIGELTRTEALGIHQASITSTTPGAKTISVVSNGIDVPVADGKTNQAIFTVVPALINSSTVTVTEGNREANGKDTHEVTVTVLDDANHPIAGANVSINAPAALTVTNQGPYISDEDGQVKIAFTSQTAGTFSVETLVGDQASTGSPVSLTFVATSSSEPEATQTVSATKKDASLAKTGAMVIPLLTVAALLGLGGIGIYFARKRS